MQLYCANWTKHHFASNYLANKAEKVFPLPFNQKTLTCINISVTVPPRLANAIYGPVSSRCCIYIQTFIQIKLKSELKLKRRLFLFPAPLSDCRVFSLCEIVPVSHTLLLTKFFETASTLLYAQETTIALLRSQFWFPDRLVILSDRR